MLNALARMGWCLIMALHFELRQVSNPAATAIVGNKKRRDWTRRFGEC
ncbi:hypothetical protein HQ393_12055 [Chitinibacter bivalviorum]|uniref:Uncharacterized protein n=1 Tax=Chitinibacter bivalviorum TaxID=2739434 RepID=A0A7H9BJR2_9NEIS|nr:hypothetical protein [Chitinibacter bivalviorum]QLG88910.1 hypothetical protein HQ393_12055 [Chitinibacter bivalviorum]